MKRFIKIIVAALLLIVGVIVLARYNIVIPLSVAKNGMINNALPDTKPDGNISLFSKCDFSKGNWSAYLVVAPEDFDDLHPFIPKRVCLKTNDRSVLQQMQKSWIFKGNKDGDMATVNSTFYLVNNGMIVFETGIVLDKNNQGLQNGAFGWMKPVDGRAMLNVCSSFKQVYWPVVIL